MTHITEFGEGINRDSPVKALRELPSRKWGQPVEGITSILILPQTKKFGLHDSGYRFMDFVACNKGTAYCLLSGYSDVAHLGGIGGFNNPNWVNDKIVNRGNWSIDCLPGNGLLQIFANADLSVGEALSSFEIFHSQERS